MKPNFETGNVDMSEAEFIELVGAVHWANDPGSPIRSFEELKRARTEFILGTLDYINDEILPVGVNPDLQTWELKPPAVKYALDRLATIGNITRVQLAYDHSVDKTRGHVPQTHNEVEGRRLAWTTFNSHTITYLGLLGCAMELETHDSQQ